VHECQSRHRPTFFETRGNFLDGKIHLSCYLYSIQFNSIIVYTGGSIKNPSESGVFVQMIQNTEPHNVDVYYRYGSYHILTKINREIF